MVLLTDYYWVSLSFYAHLIIISCKPFIIIYCHICKMELVVFIGWNNCDSCVVCSWNHNKDGVFSNYFNSARNSGLWFSYKEDSL